MLLKRHAALLMAKNVSSFTSRFDIEVYEIRPEIKHYTAVYGNNFAFCSMQTRLAAS